MVNERRKDPSWFVRLGLFFLVLTGFACGTACGAERGSVTVSLFEAHPPTRSILVEGPCKVIAPAGFGSLPPGLHKVLADSGLVVVKPVKSGPGMPVRARKVVLATIRREGLCMRHHASMLPRHYGGLVELTVRPDGMLKIRNIVPTRDYVTAVVGSETNPGWPAEALKAQAVLTQTRLFRKTSEDELPDTTQEEAYLGCDYERAPVKAAVESVWGQLLCYDHRPIQPFYHSTCAGKTSAGDEMFGRKAKAMVYLVSVDCPYCRQSPFMKPTVSRVSRPSFERVFGPGLPTVATVDAASRPLEMVLGDGRRMRGYDFWIKLGGKFGWDKVPGTRFKVKAGKGDTLEFESTGAGHGVGLCQWGARGQAEKGKTYREILQYYFPGTEIE